MRPAAVVVGGALLVALASCGSHDSCHAPAAAAHLTERYCDGTTGYCFGIDPAPF